MTAQAPITVAIKRAYEPPKRGDGYRVLVDRLWPRGVKKEDLALDTWAKDLAPSNELRAWFGHDPQRWVEFRKRYRAELAANHASATIDGIFAAVKSKRTLTLIYSASDTERNQAVVLLPYFARAAARAKSSNEKRIVNGAAAGSAPNR